MSTPVLNIINGAFRLIGISTSTPNQKNFALEALVMMLDAWNISPLNIYVNTKETLTLVASQGTYTLGVGGDLDSARPESIITIYWNASENDQDIYVKPITEPEYDDITDKTVEGRPTKWFLAPENPLAKLYLNPVPDGTDTLKITSRKPYSIVTLSDTFTLPGGYNRAIKYNLAIEIAAEYDAAVDPIVFKTATDSLNDVKRKNAVPLIMVSDVPRGTRARFKRPFNIDILE